MVLEDFAERLETVHQRVADACRRSGRDPAEVDIVAVTKTHGPDIIELAVQGGVTVFGESKVQEARAKIPRCPGHVIWHLIGHLQTNKVRPAVQLFDVIHSVDSERLLDAVEAACEETGQTLPVYLQVNISGEASKYGIAPDALRHLLERCAACPRVEVQGLMTVPPFTEEPEGARPYFQQLRALRDCCGEEWDFPVNGLSMGMSHDFEIAIEEGATCVRLGSVLFGSRGKA